MSTAKSAKYSCGAIVEIVTAEISSNNMMMSDEAADKTMETSSIKPKWYPGPEQVHGWGYLHNMGYPQYYRGSDKGEPVDCRWTIRANHGRRVRLTLLDLSIRSEFYFLLSRLGV